MVVIPHVASQSASASRSAVQAPKQRTGWGVITGWNCDPVGFGADVDARGMQVDSGELRGESGRGPGAFRLALGHGCLHNVIRRNVAAGAGAARLKHSSKRDQVGHLSPVVSPRTPGTNLTNGHKAPMGYRSRPPAAICVEDSTGWPPVPSGCTAVKRRNQPNKELGNRAGMATSYSQIGVLFTTRGTPDAAIFWTLRSLLIREE